jgi:hydroxymethylbilane synthase
MASTRVIRVATRKSALALRQTELAIAHLAALRPEWAFEVLPMSTTGDERLNWSLEKAGGKGLFTSALEEAIAGGAADLAVHSAKDLPTTMTSGVCLAGYLPREDPRDRLVLRAHVDVVRSAASSSPRRRAQLRQRFPEAEWTEIRGNVATRLNKLAEGAADASVMAVAGHRRLGIEQWAGLRFEDLAVDVCVPAAGQGAIGLQVREADLDAFAGLLCKATAKAVSIERAVLAAMGGGCHSAVAVYTDGTMVHFFNETHGYRSAQLPHDGCTDEIAAALVSQFSLPA